MGRAEVHLSAEGLNGLNCEGGDGRRESGKAHGLFEKKKGFNGTCSLTLDFKDLSECDWGRRRIKGLRCEQRGRKRK